MHVQDPLTMGTVSSKILGILLKFGMCCSTIGQLLYLGEISVPELFNETPLSRWTRNTGAFTSEQILLRRNFLHYLITYHGWLGPNKQLLERLIENSHK